MLQEYQQLKISEYQNLYDRLIPEDHVLRKFNNLVDFSFVRDELEHKYCLDNVTVFFRHRRKIVQTRGAQRSDRPQQGLAKSQNASNHQAGAQLFRLQERSDAAHISPAL